MELLYTVDGHQDNTSEVPLLHYQEYSETDHVWAKKKLSLNRRGLLIIEIEVYCWDMTKWSLNRAGGLLIQVVTRAGFTESMV